MQDAQHAGHLKHARWIICIKKGAAKQCRLEKRLLRSCMPFQRRCLDTCLNSLFKAVLNGSHSLIGLRTVLLSHSGCIEEYSRGVCRARPKCGQCRSLSQRDMLMCIYMHHMKAIRAAVNVGYATHMEYQGLFVRSEQEYVLIHSKCHCIVLAPCHGIDS